MKSKYPSVSIPAPLLRPSVKGTMLAGLTLSLLLLAPSRVAQAALIHWSGGAGDWAWTNGGNWDGGVAPDGSSDVLFDITDGQTNWGVDSVTNNFLGQNFTIGSLTYSNWTSGPTSGSTSDPADPNNLVAQHTDIGSGVVLTVTNGFVVGVHSTTPSKGFPADPLTYVTISGAGGAMAVTGGIAEIGYQVSSSATLHLYARLDMSDLGNFSYNVPGGTFGVASAVQRRSGGEVYLARTNSITGLNLWAGIGATGVAGYSAILHLGQSNNLNANSIIIGKDTEGDVSFQSGLTNPTVKIRGQDGSSPTGTVYMGWTTSSGSSWGRGTNDFTGGTIDAVMTNLNVGLHAGDIANSTTIDYLLLSPSSSNTVTVLQTLVIGSDPGGSSTTKASQCVGLVDMQGGTFTVNNLVLGSAANVGTATGTLNLHGGTFAANTVAMATSINGAIVFGNLNLSGGAMQVAANITMGNTLQGGYAGGTISVANSTLAVGGQIGASTNYFGTLTLDQATLQITPGGGTNPAVFVNDLDIESPVTLIVTNQNLMVGQFPLIAYQSLTGAGSVASLSLSVPAGVTATLVDDSTNLSVDLLVTAVTPTAAQPVAGLVSLLDANTLSIAGTGTANQPYHLYTTTNLSLPISQWTLLGTTNATPGGIIQFFDHTTNSQRFYELGR